MTFQSKHFAEATISSVVGVGCPLSIIRAAIERGSPQLSEEDRTFLTKIEKEASESSRRYVELPADGQAALTRILASDDIFSKLCPRPQPETD